MEFFHIQNKKGTNFKTKTNSKYFLKSYRVQISKMKIRIKYSINTQIPFYLKMNIRWINPKIFKNKVLSSKLIKNKISNKSKKKSTIWELTLIKCLQTGNLTITLTIQNKQAFKKSARLFKQTKANSMKMKNGNQTRILNYTNKLKQIIKIKVYITIKKI